MVGFLLKIFLVVILVGGIGAVVLNKSGRAPAGVPDLATLSSGIQMSLRPGALNSLREVDAATLSRNLSSALDSLVTHPSRNSPVVLGVKITEESLSTLVEVIEQMPPDQVSQLQAVVCNPQFAGESARE